MNKLFARILFGVLLAVLASFVLLQVLVVLGIENDLKQTLPPDIRKHALWVQNTSQQLDSKQFQQMLQRLQKQSEVPSEVVDLTDPQVPTDLRRALGDGHISWLLKEQPNHDVGLMVYVPLPNSSQVYISGPDTYFPLPGWRHLLWMAALVSAVVLAISYFITRPLHRGLRQLEIATQKLEQGKLDARAHVNSNDAVGKVAHRFNAMADRVQELLEVRLNAIQAIAHELRTPIARIHFGLEMLVEEENPDKKQRRLESVNVDLREIEQMVSEFLVFARYDVGNAAPAREPHHPVAAIVEAQVERMRPLHRGKQIEVELPSNPEPSLEVHPRSFERVVHNLLSNALRYANKRVRVSLHLRPHTLFLVVDDDGPGIPADQRTAALEPFYRLDQSRSRDSGGVGLGLAIVSQAVKAHRGTVEIAESDLGGAKLVTAWPR